MNKKIISRILLGSVLTLPLCVVAVSCHIETKSEDKKTGLTSKEVEKQTDGFGDPKISREILNDEANRVTIDYLKKDEVLASKIDKNNLIFSDFNPQKFKILITDLKARDEKRRIVVNFKIVDLNNENNQSNEREIILSGFKIPLDIANKLISLAKNINVDYPNKDKVYPWKVVSKYLDVTNVSSNIIVSDLKVTGLNSKNFNTVVSFFLTYKEDTSIKIKHSIEVSGFRKLPNDYSNLTKTLFSETKELFNLDDKPEKTLMLYKELAKPDAEVAFNFASNQILIPAKKQIVNITNPKTYIEVGSLTDVYKMLHNQLNLKIATVISDAMSRSDDEIYYIFTKILTSQKEDAIKLFEENKTKLIEASNNPKLNVEFYKDFYKDLENLIKRDNFTVSYNHKTGIFSMQSGDEEIDYANPETSIDLMRVRTDIRKMISAKIKEYLESEKIDTTLMNLFLKDRNSRLLYLIQKNGNTITNGFKIKQICRCES